MLKSRRVKIFTDSRHILGISHSCAKKKGNCQIKMFKSSDCCSPFFSFNHLTPKQRNNTNYEVTPSASSLVCKEQNYQYMPQISLVPCAGDLVSEVLAVTRDQTCGDALTGRCVTALLFLTVSGKFNSHQLESHLQQSNLFTVLEIRPPGLRCNNNNKNNI